MKRMSGRRLRAMRARGLAGAALALALAGCATAPLPVIRNDSDPAAGPLTSDAPPSEGTASAKADGAPTPAPEALVQSGTGALINQDAARAPRSKADRTGEASFNFEGESLHTVIKTILGDLLQQNYVIAPGVQGTVTLAAQSVDSDQAYSLLDMVLGWNNAALVWSDGRYNIVPADKALPGNLAPRIDAPSRARGFEVRAVPLEFVSAAEMEKLLKPYARERAVVHVDTNRNLIVVAGTRAELETYLHTIEVFDVDWLAGMSVGIYRLQSAQADRVVQQLEQIFGEAGKTPLAGMVRLMPMGDDNSVLAITPQPKYLKDIEQWITRLDTGSEGVRLYTYEARYVKAQDLGEKLKEIFGGSAPSRSARSGGLAPGLEPVSLSTISGSSSRPAADGEARSNRDSESPAQRGRDGRSSDGVAIGAGEVAVSAMEESNTLLIRTTPAQWESIQRALERMDTMPLQVHIEAQIVEVTLQGALEYGVSWFFENAIPNINEDSGLSGLRDRARDRDITGDIAGAVGSDGVTWTWLGRNALATITALDTASDVRVLSTPSLMVRNNVEAELNVGQNIPVTTTSFNPFDEGAGSGGAGAFNSVQYLQTGVTLKVKPRVSAEGMVFMEISQEVSSPASEPTEEQPNVTISTKNLITEAAVRSGETVMLAGLITENQGKGTSGVPGLSRIPVLGALFGTRSTSNQRSELVIFITPTVIRDPLEARQRTLEYGRRFRALEPLQRPKP